MALADAQSGRTRNIPSPLRGEGRRERLQPRTRGEGFSALLGILLALSCAAATDDKPVQKDAHVRVLGREGRVLLSRENIPLCVAQLRPAKDAPEAVIAPEALAAALKATTGKDAPLADSAEQLREFSYPLPTGNKEDELSVVLRARRVSYGTRLLASGVTRGPTKRDLAPDETLPPAAPLELAIQIFADAQGKAATLTYVDNQRQPAPADDEARAEAERRDLAGREINARALVFEGGGGFRVNVARSAPVAWSIQRVENGWIVRQRLQPDPRDPANIGSFILYLGGWPDEATPEVSPVTLSQPQVPARDFVEGSARVYASGADVFNLSELAVVAEVAFPPQQNGDVPLKRLPCFFWEAPASKPGEGEFRFRFAPPKEGLYGVRIVVVTSTGQVRSDALPLRAGPPATPGFVRTKAGLRLFTLDNGDAFFPVGVRLFSDEKERITPERARKAFIELARRGVNTAHVVLKRENFPFELERAGRYDANVAAELDEILRAAQVRGIHLILGLECGDDIGKKSQQHPYFRELGGPLSASPEFFRDVKARKLYQSRLTYIAARYGAYRSVMSWELIEGVERAWPAVAKDPEDRTLPPAESDLSRRGRRDIQEWAFEAAQFLRGMDQHEHPICVSSAIDMDRPWLELERVSTLDWVLRQVSFPLGGDAAAQVDNADETALMARWLSAAREPGTAHKPVLIEHSVPKNWAEPLNISEITRMRNSLRYHWMHASWAAGSAGSVITDWAIDARHQPMSTSPEALSGLNLVAFAYTKAARTEMPDELRYVSGEIEGNYRAAPFIRNAKLRFWGRTGRRGLCVWLQDAAYTWRADPDPRRVENAELKLPGLEEGKYLLKWIHPQTGELAKQELYDAPAKKVDQPLAPLLLKVPGVNGALILTAERIQEEKNE
ncbi:MAG TPA: hypothetical protein VEJ63_24380 [Planctomycetota bacterium]|nr:hypothetical protein [Planctomycetota bacterium]